MVYEVEASRVLSRARDKGWMIATAESCTGGLIFGALTEIAGSSDVMDRGFVTYSNDAKSEMLSVPPALIDVHGAVSEDVAAAMASGALAHSQADLSVSVTGVAGPGGTASKPEGMVCFGIATRENGVRTETQQFGAIGRSAVRRATVAHALGLLEKSLS